MSINVIMSMGVGLSFEERVIKPVLASIERFSDGNAFFIEDQFYTYKQFGGFISIIREQLKGLGGENNKIGLVINNDIQTYASIFSLWFEGKCYVPLHPEWPMERCLNIVEQMDISCILDSSSQSRYVNSRVINTTGIEGKNCEHCGAYVDCSDEALAYVLFTSGSTGKPKGVQISRGNVAAFIDSFFKTGISITENDRCLQCFDLSFDVSVQSYLSALTKGACVYTVPYGQMKFLSVAQLIDEQQITFGALPPSTLRYLQPYFDELDFTAFRQCILTAEACPADLVYDWLKYAPNTQVWDFYGPTECTIYCTSYRIDGHNDTTYNGIVSIGKPMANVEAFILDEQGNVLSQGEKGELCVAGPQVSQGYWNDSDKNAAAYSILQTGGVEIRIYHTGDLCFEDEQGNILYSGRIDNQAKIQGFRVELSEIEYHAHTFLKDRNVICIAYKNDLALDEIVMCIESEAFDTKELVGYLRGQMPHYMIPDKIVFLDRFPINSNGKIDRRLLKDLIFK